MSKRVIILGSTGSIGSSAIDVISRLGDQWEIVGLAAGSRAAELADQANRFRPQVVAISDGEAATALTRSLEYAPTVLVGDDAMVRLLDEQACECVVCAVVGSGGLSAAIRAVELGRHIALANKEALVMAGALIMPLAARTGATIIPVDSEHSAIFQILHGRRASEVHKVYLTASGGPFRTWSEETMNEITVQDALQHPTWKMGPKITIDSATMMNKAMEIVEAHWLFGLEADRIEVVIHPESIIHSIVEFCDGSMIAQLGMPDMRTPIQYALTYPDRLASPTSRLDLLKLRQLSFHPPDDRRFPALRLGFEVARRGGTSGAVLNAANEAAVTMFREGVIHFRDITRYTEQAMNQHEFNAAPALEDLLAADRWAREEVARCTAC